MPALMSAAMMLAMMVPSVAPTLWRYHRAPGAMGAPGTGRCTALVAMGYACVWAIIGVALFATSSRLFPMGMASRGHPLLAPWAGAIVLCVGAVQRSRWKATRLLRCREAFVKARPSPGEFAAAWRDGLRLGVDCAMSCAAPMAVLVVAGLMDMRVMLAITAAITAERVAPAGARLARLTGALALIAGVVLCVRCVLLTAK